MTDRVNLYEEHAREIANMPREWSAWKFDTVQRNPDGSALLCITGEIAPTITRGKNAGRPNWRQSDRSTRRTVYLSTEQHKAWCLEWEKKTGKCHECTGTGEVFASWDRDSGTTYKQCGRCLGDGKAKP